MLIKRENPPKPLYNTPRPAATPLERGILGTRGGIALVDFQDSDMPSPFSIKR